MDCADARRIGIAWARRRPGLCTALSITPEDVGGEAVVAFLESGRVDHRKIIDRVRHTYGRSTSYGRNRPSARAAVALQTLPILDERVDDSATRAELLAEESDPFEEVDTRETAHRELARLFVEDPRLASMLLLRANGWTLAEVGRRFGLTESRVCQILLAA